MRLGEPGRMQAGINVTPLVNVVLVLLIIFMVMTLRCGTNQRSMLPGHREAKRSGR